MLGVVVSVNRYDFKDQSTGRAIKGAKIVVVVDERADQNERRGLTHLETSCSEEVYSKLAMAAPCVADLTVGIKGVGDKGGLTITDAVIRPESAVEFVKGRMVPVVSPKSK